jgi:hypothetical protein
MIEVRIVKADTVAAGRLRKKNDVVAVEADEAAMLVREGNAVRTGIRVKAILGGVLIGTRLREKGDEFEVSEATAIRLFNEGAIIVLDKHKLTDPTELIGPRPEPKPEPTPDFQDYTQLRTIKPWFFGDRHRLAGEIVTVPQHRVEGILESGVAVRIGLDRVTDSLIKFVNPPAD